MSKFSSKYLLFFSLIAIFGGNQSLCAWPNFFDSISSLFGTPKVIEPVQPKIDALDVPDDAMQLVVRQKPKPAASSQSAVITSPTPVVEKKKHSDAKLRFIAGDKLVDDGTKAIKEIRDTVAKTRVDSEKTMHDMRETALLIRFTVIPVAILTCVLMVKSIFPSWFPGSSPKKIIGSKCELD